jgi:hypothetical protein
VRAEGRAMILSETAATRLLATTAVAGTGRATRARARRRGEPCVRARLDLARVTVLAEGAELLTEAASTARAARRGAADLGAVASRRSWRVPAGRTGSTMVAARRAKYRSSAARSSYPMGDDLLTIRLVVGLDPATRRSRRPAPGAEDASDDSQAAAGGWPWSTRRRSDGFHASRRASTRPACCSPARARGS